MDFLSLVLPFRSQGFGMRPASPVSGPVRFSSAESSGRRKPRTEDLIRFISDRSYESYQAEFRETQSSKTREKRFLETFMAEIGPPVRQKAEILARRHHLPVEQTHATILVHLPPGIIAGFQSTSDCNGLNQYLARCITNTVKWKRYEILDQPREEWSRQILRWLHKAEAGFTRKPSQSELIEAALPFYLAHRNHNRERRFLRGESQDFIPIDWEKLDETQREPYREKFAQMVRRALKRTQIPLSSSALDTGNKSVFEALQPPGESGEDDNPFRIWSRLKPDERQYLMETSHNGNHIKLLIAAESAGESTPAEVVADRFGVPVRKAGAMLREAKFHILRRLQERHAKNGKTVEKKKAWTLQTLLISKPQRYQARLLSILPINQAWAIIFHSGVLGHKPMTPDTIEKLFDATGSEIRNMRYRGYQTLMRFLKSGIPLERLPQIEPITALSLLPADQFEGIIRKLPDRLQSALRTSIVPGSYKRAKAIQALLNSRCEAINRLGSPSIEKALINAYPDPKDVAPLSEVESE